MWISSNRDDWVSSAHISFLSDSQVEARAAAGQKSFDHVVGLKSNPKFVARQARLCDDDPSAADQELISEMHRIFPMRTLLAPIQ
jgi:hypothetical protein